MIGEKVDKSKDKKRKYTKKKSKKFKLSDYDQMIVDATDEKLREIVVKELEENIASLVNRVNQLNSSKNPQEDTKENEAESKDKNSTKKNVVIKLRKFKKCLSDEIEIKKRVKLLKIKRRKLRKIVEKVQEKIRNIAKKNLRCFRCRKRGHTIVDCKDLEEAEKVQKEENSNKTLDKEETEAKDENEDKKEDQGEKLKAKTKPLKPKQANSILCYNCGANDHSIHGCSLKVDYANLPFAECFICKNKGHLSSNCPTSDKGIYIRGGSCFLCKAKDHLAKNCPQKQIQIEQSENNHELLNKKRRNFSEKRNNSTDNNNGRFRDKNSNNKFGNKFNNKNYRDNRGNFRGHTGFKKSEQK